MLDLELDDRRGARAAPRAAPKERGKTKPVLMPLHLPRASSRTTEAQLQEALSQVHNSLCSLDWAEAANHAMRCADIWCMLPEDVRESIWHDYPEAPAPLSEGCGDAWLVFATWHVLWWRREIPGIDYTGEGPRLADCPF